MKHRPTYDVYLRTPDTDPDDLVPIRVVIKHGDQLRAELEAPRNGLPSKMEAAPMHYTTLWVWAALLREHVIPLETGFQEFMTELLEELEVVPREDPAPGTFVGESSDPTTGGTSSPSA